MADNTILSAAVGTGDTIRTDDVGSSVKIPVSKIALGGDGVDSGFMASGAGAVGTTVPRVTLASDDPAVASLALLDNAISGSEMQVDVVTLPALPAGTNNIGDVDVLTVPAPLNLTGGGVEASALRVTLANDSTGVLSVDDNGSTISVDDGAGSLTVDGTVAVSSVGGTVAVSAASLPLPSGAATAAKQPALGTAGTPSSDVISVQGVASGTVIPVSDGGGALTVDNGGTFAVQESGGALTALQVMDDWDESDRAKVNPIVGQAGVAAGAGAVGATVQRVTLASDDPAVAALQTLDNIVAGNEAQVDVITLPATPAGTNLIGSVNAMLDASTMRDGAGTALTPKFVAIDAAASGDNTLLAAVASKKIRVLSVFLIAAAAVNVRFESGASGTALTGQMNLAANSGFVLPFNPVGWFETAVNTLLNLELSGAISVDGCLCYVEV